MAKNFIQGGVVIEYTAGAAIAPGSPVAIGSIIGVALDAVSQGEVGVAAIEGVYELPKATGSELTVGQVVDLDVSTGKITKIDTPATGDLVGCAVVFEAASPTDTTVRVKINIHGATVTAA